ncbi:J domain-containing protein [Enhygromyxa salina]|uniref:Chaperone protein DnaJ n=1 Tax=Enhygromyxa salina TaxID=215803 RepID=A0A2S9YLV1_9BACT|nr:J domain-containing protein [Enhygromyxa salina]PRQ06048.1 Chaperone protein DnaJ [Enhygromyxa salina]
MSDVDYYAILGVGPEAERDEIQDAYQREFLRVEPGRARVLMEACAVLLDPAARAAYDARAVGSALIEETVTAILQTHLPRAEARRFIRAQRQLIAATRPDAQTPSS